MNPSTTMNGIYRSRASFMKRCVNPLPTAFLTACSRSSCLATIPLEYQYLPLLIGSRRSVSAPITFVASRARRFSTQVGGQRGDQTVALGHNRQALRGGDFEVTGSLLDARRAGANIPSRGEFLQLSHAFDPESVAAFAAYSGDTNPIHLNEDYARRGGIRNYDGCLVQGLLVAGLFPAAFGRSIPGSLYVSQSLRFESPTLVGERVTARIEVEKVRATSSGNEVLVRCSTVASLPNQKVVISGQAQVLLPRSCDVR